ncbi:MAG: hypothetical protein JW776_13445 [Candidatus Lokiarchaeota archaeon]|nr:hypothetical protein [Candidatus Lokiarchaeota archaeon]
MPENEKLNSEEVHTEGISKGQFKRSTHPRYDWLDQFRGMVIVFLVIASLTWELASENFAITPPLGPTWLNHGWEYYDQQPVIITIIDLGSQIFMFMLGISLSLSFKSKVEKKGLHFAWLTVLHRVFSFFWISQVISVDFDFPIFKVIALVIWVLITVGAAVLRNLRKFKDNIYRPLFGVVWALSSIGLWCVQARIPKVLGSGYFWSAFFLEAPAHLAWGTLFAAVFVFLIKKPDFRIIIAIIIYLGHFIMWEFKPIINASIQAFWSQWDIPFDMLAMGAIAITATCIWDWMQMDPNDQIIGFKKRVIPIMLITGLLHFIVDFFQTAEHHGINLSLGLLAIAFSCLLVIVFFSLEFFYKYKIPPLTHIGRNALFLFLFQGIFTLTYPEIWGDALAFRTQMASLFGVAELTHPLVDLMGLIAFLVPMLIMYLVAWLMDRYHIYIKV